MPSEFDFIDRIRKQAAGRADADLILGIGDDAAILRERSGRETLVTVDLLVEEIDFKLESAPPHWLGHKALAVSLSDIAAMGGVPRFSLLTLGVPGSRPQSEKFWDDFFAGYFALAARHGVSLIGGDISSTPDRLTLDSFVIGHCASGKSVRRGQARIGDKIYLTGYVGASAAGLRLLLQGARAEADGNSLTQQALRAHLRPEPRVGFGARIGEAGAAHAMIDVSDGLSQDLAHICQESRVAAIIDFDSLPIAEEVKLVADNREEAFSLAVSGGEDFELLLTSGEDSEDELFALARDCKLKLTRIGEIIRADQSKSAVLLRRNDEIKPLSTRGFDHFLV
jgi:thiamine-monophosphate kinase